MPFLKKHSIEKSERNTKYNNQPISIIIGIEISTSKLY